MVVTMGCGDECPYIPGKRYLDWDLQDPKGRPVEEVRATETTSRAGSKPLIRRAKRLTVVCKTSVGRILHGQCRRRTSRSHGVPTRR